MHLTLLKPISSINFAFGFIKAQYINNHDPWGTISPAELKKLRRCGSFYYGGQQF
jgi:hypothetical protein